MAARKKGVAPVLDPQVLIFDSLPDSARIRPAAAAQLLGVSLGTVYRFITEGRLPKLRKIGTSSGFSAGELRQVLRGSPNH